MLVLVVPSEPFVRGEDLTRDDEFVRGSVERPEVGTEDPYTKVDVTTSVVARLFDKLVELVGQILAQTHIWRMSGHKVIGVIPTGEHALKFVAVLETAGILELRDHARFSFAGYREVMNETPA